MGHPAKRPEWPIEQSGHFAKAELDLILDRDVRHFPFRLRLYLDVWRYDHPGRYPSIAKIAGDFDVDEKTVRTALDELEVTGWLGSERVGPRLYRRAELGYELRTPGPRCSLKAPTETQGWLFKDEVGQRKKPPESAEENFHIGGKNLPPIAGPPSIKREIEKQQQPEEVAAAVSLDPNPELPGRPATLTEIIDDLVLRCQELTPSSEGDVRGALRKYSTEELDAGITDADLSGRHIRSFGGILWYTEQARKRLKTQAMAPMVRVVSPPEEPKPSRPPTPEEIANAIEMAKREGGVGAVFRKILEGWERDGIVPGGTTPQPAQNETGCGPTSRVYPQPVGGSFQQGRHDYTTARKPQKSRPLNWTGQRARQDSNLQPSDSKSASHEDRTENKAAPPDDVQNNTSEVKNQRKLADWRSAGFSSDRISPSDISSEHKPRGSL